MAIVYFKNVYLKNASGRAVGNKAARLAELAIAGFRVPPFYVVPADTPSIEAIAAEIDTAAEQLAAHGGTVAVRSSAAEEDGAEHSFAGQFDSFLDVEPKDVLERVRDVRRSGESEHVLRYRAEHALGTAVGRPAVMVQRMVPADAAGVAFAADPISGDTDTVVVAATRGLGDALVSGECQGDTWRTTADGRLIDSDVAEAGQPVLTRRQLRKVVHLVRDISKQLGRPQDIEWAIRGNRLYLLQSRDITALSQQDHATWALWDNSNIVESYGGVTTPLTFSVARSAYAEAYRHFGRVIGVNERQIAANERTYEQMIGLIDGRVYYNLLNWYRLLMQTPGFRFNKGFMEQMMGVTEGVPDSALPKGEDSRPGARLRAISGMARVGGRLARKHVTHSKRVAAFHARIEAVLVPAPLEVYSLEQLLDYYDDLQSKVIPAWDTPLINDLYCMSFHGLLRKLCEQWLPEELVDVHNELVAGEAGIISLEPVRRMREMARLIGEDAAFARLLTAGSATDIEQAMTGRPPFERAYRAYLDLFGDRCMDELKLESETLADDPLPLLRTVGHMCASSHRDGESDTLRDDAEAAVGEALRRHPVRRRVFGWILRLARDRVRDRENLRFERTRVYGRVRSIFIEIGKRLEFAGVLGNVDDVFYLDVREIADFVRGTGPSAAIGALATGRRSEFDVYRGEPSPPRRFTTQGPPQLTDARRAVGTASRDDDPDARRGQACSPGIVRGPVRIVRDPRKATVQQGDILVAERTDPGWVTIFPLVSGMIMERGSLLSHSAIVARELKLPCIVGVEDACLWLEDGEWVEIDGARGTIRRLAADERAA